MRTCLALLLLAGCATTPPSAPAAPEPAPPAPSPAEAEAPAAAAGAAHAWLHLVDTGAYARSWEEASSLFRDALPQQQWVDAVRSAREPLGEVVSRKLTSATRATSLPGAPDGDYVVLQYATTFANKKQAVETVTPMLDTDGRFRVSGYFVR